MRSSLSRRRFLRGGCLSLLGLGSIGCGTILHPERKGQPAGRLDWAIVALDALGLLFFFIPGVIAFAVDFNNGTIYLPPGYIGANEKHRKRKRLVAIHVPDLERTPASIEAAIARHAGRQISVTAGDCRTEELENLDQFWERHDQLATSEA